LQNVSFQCNGILFFALAYVDGVKVYGMAIEATNFNILPNDK